MRTNSPASTPAANCRHRQGTLLRAVATETGGRAIRPNSCSAMGCVVAATYQLTGVSLSLRLVLRCHRQEDTWRLPGRGWGGVDAGEDPAFGQYRPRYSARWGPDRQVHGGSTTHQADADRSLQESACAIRQVKKDWPDCALIVSLVVTCVEES